MNTGIRQLIFQGVKEGIKEGTEIIQEEPTNYPTQQNLDLSKTSSILDGEYVTTVLKQKFGLPTAIMMEQHGSGRAGDILKKTNAQ